MTAATRLSIRGLSRAFGSRTILQDLALDVAPGEFVSILGPSGAGKSTLFRILTGALAADAGRIDFDGLPLAGARDRFAFMPQRDALMPWRRVIDNATLGLEVQGMTRRAARARVAPLFTPFGLAGTEAQYPAQLSGGMRQRVGLLRTVVQNRPMLLLDEPFGALDALTRAGLQQWLAGMWDRNRWTVLLVTHDIREAIFLSDRIHVLSASPARSVLDLAVPLPRPRRLQDLASPAVSELEARLIAALVPPDTPQDPADDRRDR